VFGLRMNCHNGSKQKQRPICQIFCRMFAVWFAACAAVQSTEMKDIQKQDAASDVRDDQPTSTEMKTDVVMSESEEGVTKMDTIPAPVAVTTTEPSAEH